MQISTVANSGSATLRAPTAQLLRPLHRQSLRPTSFSPIFIRQTLHCGSRLRFTCSASDQDQQNAESDVRPEASKTKLADKGAETEVPKLGLPGTIATWALLIVSAGWMFSASRCGNIQDCHQTSLQASLCGTQHLGCLQVLFGGSLFFTFSRSFLPDMQPLDTQSSELTSKGF